MSRMRTLAVAVSLVFGAGHAGLAAAAPGTLDPGFDVTVDGGSTDESALDVAVGASGKVYVLDALGGASYKVLRFKTDGTLDTAFGTGGGIPITAANNAFTGLESFLALAVDESASAIYLGGAFGTLSSGARMMVKKLGFNGSFDAAYGGTGSNGRAQLDTPGDGAAVRIAFQGTKLLLAGVDGTLGFDDEGNYTIVDTSPYIGRLTATGTVDGSFTQTPIDWGTTNEAPTGIAVQASGTLLVSGITGLTTKVRGGTGSALARLSANGGLDAGFGTGGTFKKSFVTGACAGAAGDACETIGLYYPQTGGAFLMSIYVNRDGGANDEILVQKFNANGTVSGAVKHYPAGDYLDNGTPTLQTDGATIVAKETPSDPPNDLRVYRIEGYSVIGAPNTPPVAVNNTVKVPQDSPGAVIKPLGNDSDPDGDLLTITKVTVPLHGTVVIAPQKKTVTYTPAAGFHGKDHFDYTISDGRGGKATATVNITVQAP